MIGVIAAVGVGAATVWITLKIDARRLAVEDRVRRLNLLFEINKRFYEYSENVNMVREKTRERSVEHRSAFAIPQLVSTKAVGREIVLLGRAYGKFIKLVPTNMDLPTLGDYLKLEMSGLYEVAHQGLEEVHWAEIRDRVEKVIDNEAVTNASAKTDLTSGGIFSKI